MKKIFFLVLILIATFISIATVQAQERMMEVNGLTDITEDPHGESLDEVLAAVLKQQDKDNLNQIECNLVSNDDFEKLGEAWMSVMHPDPEVHERMDQMMGGEGSQSLRVAHITMGKRYLGCVTGDQDRYYNGMGMMGGMGMTSLRQGYGRQVNAWNNWKGSDQSMMGNFGMGSGFFGFGGLFTLLFWGLVLFAIVVLARLLSRQNKTSSINKTALDILKERYAKGEIDKKEFEQKKKDLV